MDSLGETGYHNKHLKKDRNVFMISNLSDIFLIWSSTYIYISYIDI